MVSPNEFKKGMKLDIDGAPYNIVEFQHIKPGKGNAFVRTRLKNLLTGKILERNIRTVETYILANVEEHEMQFMYKDAEGFHFMNNQDYEQVALQADQVGETANFLMENLDCRVLFHNGKAVSVEPPNTIVAEIMETEPGFKGDTATGATKVAKLVTGATVMVPLHLNQGDKIKVDTRSGEYLERM
jgi:elongation factor P